jgi:hypothetical protein
MRKIQRVTPLRIVLEKVSTYRTVLITPSNFKNVSLELSFLITVPVFHALCAFAFLYFVHRNETLYRSQFFGLRNVVFFHNFRIPLMHVEGTSHLGHHCCEMNKNTQEWVYTRIFIHHER